MLRKLSFKNYKSFKAKQDITFKPITVLVGPNSAGKSSIIKLIGLLKQSIFQQEGNEFLKYDGHIFDLKNFNNISHRYKDGDIKISMIIDQYIETEDEVFEPCSQVFRGTNRDYFREIKLKLTDDKNDNQLEIRSYPSKKNHLSFEYASGNSSFISHEIALLMGLIVKRISSGIKEITNWHKKSGYNLKEITLMNWTPKIKNNYEEDIYSLCWDHISTNCDRIGFIPSNVSSSFYREQYLDRMLQMEDFDPEFDTFYDRTDFHLSQIEKQREHIRGRFGDRKLRKEFEDAMADVKEHWNMLKEKGYLQNAKMKKDIYMQIMCYYDYLIFHYLENHQHLINQIDNYCSNLELDLRLSFKDIFHFPALRPKPKRYYTSKELDEIFGFDEPSIFVTDEHKKTSKYIQLLGFNYTIGFEQISKKHDLYAVILTELDSGVSSYLDEVGFGFSQVLPYIGRKGYGHSASLQILEQPELHLHPKAQAAFAKFLIEFYTFVNPFIADKSKITLDENRKIESSPFHGNYLIETHSEHILRGLQVEVAKGNLDKDNISVYYVGKRKNGNSYIKELKLNDNGRFADKWPEGFYETGFKQAMELMKAT